MSSYVEDGKIWAYYDVTTTESATTLIGATTGIGGTMNVDGVDVSRATSYTFSTTGIHLVKFTPTTAYIGRNVFRNIARIVELYLPSTITRTDGANENVNCINGCANLVTIGLSDSFRNAYAHDFKNLSSLTEIKNYEVIRTVGNYAFQSLPNWNVELNLPNMTSLGERAFQATGITKIVNLGSITTIPGGANSSNAPFLNCSKLTEATLPATLTTITQFSFYNCAKLKRLTMLSVTPPSLGSNAFRGTTSLDVILVPAESVETYKTASGWSYWSSKIYPIGDEKRLAINHLSLGDFRRRIMIGISEIPPLYPDNYVDDGYIWAYYNVTDTENPTTLVYADLSYLGANFIIDGETVARTATYTFSTTGEHLVKMQRTGATRANQFRCSALVRIYFPNTVTGIGESCFLGATNLTHVWLPNTITDIANRAFEECSNLNVINTENTLITVVNGSNNYGTFHNCSSIKKINLPTSVTVIEPRSFQSCVNLKKINLSDLTVLSSIGTLAFNGAMISIRWKAATSLTSIANQAFQASKIIEADLGDTQLTTISGSTNYGAFMNCSKLEKVTLPATLTSLAQRVFYQCYALEIIICKATAPPTISSQSLPGTSYVQHIYVPAESVETYKAASGWSSYASKIEAIPTT